ncbi:MAG: hypothetical protein NXY57DRAFT_957777 [Lentinula lateritia]|nr:MAG: hypothetical protein NXY57DRAFT_957777 [Lentinula lateritia]
MDNIIGSKRTSTYTESWVNPTGTGIGSARNDAPDSHTSPTEKEALSPCEFGFKASHNYLPKAPDAPPLGPLRSTSNDATITSPPLSAGPVSLHGGQPIPSVASSRKAGRVFDPARGVELFKRGSEEVLATFLKMSYFTVTGN